MVMAGENHPLHIKEHLSLLANPEVRNNGEYAQGVMMHCNQHADAWDMGIGSSRSSTACDRQGWR